MGKYYSETIQHGSSGESVKEWQRYLNTQGYGLIVNGIFGDKTKAATTEYQTKNGLTADGIVGKNTWGKAGYSDINTPVSAPTTNPMPTKPEYDSTSWDDTAKGSAALGAYDSAKDAVNNYGPFQYVNEEQYKAVMDKILNREKFTYDFNGDALYHQYKDKFIKQGKMAMGDAIGQASAMTGGYGNSYAQSVGQQAYQAQLENLNDIVPELYQMALDKYNTDGQDLYNQFSMLGADYDRAYGQYQDGYDKLLDALGVAKSDYYDGADMFHTEQSNRNSVANQQFNDAMSIWQNETDNAWKQAEWDETARQNALTESWRQKEYDAQYGNKLANGSVDKIPNTGTDENGKTHDNGGYGSDVVAEAQDFVGADVDGKWGPDSVAKAKELGYNSIADVVKAMANGGDNKGVDISTVPSTVINNLKSKVTVEEQAEYIASLIDKKIIDKDQGDELMAQYASAAVKNRVWEVTKSGGANWFGIGINANARVKDQFDNEYSLAELRKILSKSMDSEEVTKYLEELQEELGIKTGMFK